MAAEGMPFPWWWNGGTISTVLDDIWGMSVDMKFMVLRRELEPKIFKFPCDQTTRFTEGFWGEDVQFIDDFSEAKLAMAQDLQ